MRRYNIWQDGDLVAEDLVDFSLIPGLIEADIADCKSNMGEGFVLTFADYEIEVIESFNAVDFLEGTDFV